MKNVHEYKSHDFYLSSCLLAAKLPLLRLEREDAGKFVVFVFDNSNQQAESILKNHWDRTLRIPTKDILDSIIQLKTRLHSGV